MTVDTIAAIILAAVAVLGSIGSVLLLSFRVGSLTGKMDARITHGETDRDAIWKAIGAVTDRFNRHTEQHSKRSK